MSSGKKGGISHGTSNEKPSTGSSQRPTTHGTFDRSIKNDGGKRSDDNAVRNSAPPTKQKDND